MRNPTPMTRAIACAVVLWQRIKARREDIEARIVWGVAIIAGVYILSYAIYLAECFFGVA